MSHDPSASVDVLADPELDQRHAVAFSVVRRGYDQPQVEHVLVELTARIEALSSEVAELREREADVHAALDAAEYRARTAEAAVEELVAAAAPVVERAATDEEIAGDRSPQAQPQPEAEAVPAEPPALPTRPAAPGADVATMVGEETTRIVEAARHAAVEIRARARDDGERVVADAREEARSIRAEAEVQLMHRTREADDAVAARLLEAADAVQEAQARADAIVADAFTEAATVVLRAREEADALVAAGERSSRELGESAAAARDDLLVDLLRRRRNLRRQVEQLEAGRVRLRAAYAVVEDTLAEASGELDRTVAEARDAAVAAAERSDAAVDLEVRAAAIALGVDPDVLESSVDPEPDAAPAAEGTSDPVGDAAPAAHRDARPDDATGPDPAPAEPGRELTSSTVTADPSGLGDAATTDTTDRDRPTVAVAAEAEIDLRSDPSVAPDDGANPGEPEAAPDVRPTATAPIEARGGAGAAGDVEPTDEPAPRRRRPRAPDPVEFEGRWSSAVRVLPPGPETAADHPLPSRPAPASAGRSSSASEVFARLRAGDSHQPSLFDAPNPADAEAARFVGPPGSTDLPPAPKGTARSGPADEPGDSIDPEGEWIVRRDAAVAPAVRALRRRLKATLADDEDSLLEAIRRSDPVPPTIESVRDARARRDDLAAALVASLVTTANAGIELAAAAPVAARADAAGGGPAIAVDEIAVDLADAVVGPLEERLERCFARYHRAVADAMASAAIGGPGIEPGSDAGATAEGEAATAALVSSIKAAYRARRGAQVQVPTEHAVLLACHRGLVAALQPGTPLRWVVAGPAAASRRASSGEAAEVDVASAPSRECGSCVAVADVGAGDPFGHGPLVPPARPGCRCAVAPVSAVVPRRA